MKIIKENIMEILLLLGMINLSIAGFILNPFSGFLITGTLLIALSLLTYYTYYGNGRR